MSVQVIIHRSHLCKNIMSDWLVEYIMGINTQLIDCVSTSNYFNWAEGMRVCKLFKYYESNIDIFLNNIITCRIYLVLLSSVNLKINFVYI